MLVTIAMTLTHKGAQSLTFRRVDDSDPVKEARLLRRACERLGVTDHILLLISADPYPGDTAQALTVTVKYKETMRFVSRFLPENAPAPLDALFVFTGWLTEQSEPRTTLHLLIVPAPSVQDEKTMREAAIRRVLRHHVVEAPGVRLYTKNVWALWAAANPGAMVEDQRIAGIHRVNVRDHILPAHPKFPRSTVKRIGAGTERYWPGYALRAAPMIPSCPVGCWCSA